MVKQKLYGFTAENEIDFIARRINKGDRYGLNDCLTHDEDQPLIEFWDCRYSHDSLGQFTGGRYYVGTILESNRATGLNLHGGVPEWKVDQGSLLKVLMKLAPDEEEIMKAYKERFNYGEIKTKDQGDLQEVR